MDIYVPPHLKKIPLINQMCQAIEGYAEYYEDYSSNFDDYRYFLKLDPVKRFLSLCIPQGDIDDDEYELRINYISKLFYSVKGTNKVLEYMKRYLSSLDIQGDIIYTINYIEINLGNVCLDDEVLFYQCLDDFLKELLYFEKISINSNVVNLKISSKIDNIINAGITVYSSFSPENYEETITV